MQGLQRCDVDVMDVNRAEGGRRVVWMWVGRGMARCDFVHLCSCLTFVKGAAGGQGDRARLYFLRAEL